MNWNLFWSTACMPALAQTPTEQPDSPGILRRLAERARYSKAWRSSFVLTFQWFLSFCNTYIFISFFLSFFIFLGKPRLNFRVLGRRHLASLVLIMKITSSQWLTVMWSGPLMSEVPCRREFRQLWKITCHLEIDQPIWPKNNVKVNIEMKGCCFLCLDVYFKCVIL